MLKTGARIHYTDNLAPLRLQIFATYIYIRCFLSRRVILVSIHQSISTRCKQCILRSFSSYLARGGVEVLNVQDDPNKQIENMFELRVGT